MLNQLDNASLFTHVRCWNTEWNKDIERKEKAAELNKRFKCKSTDIFQLENCIAIKVFNTECEEQCLN